MIIKVKHPSLDIYRKNISLMKINNIMLVLRTCIILLTLFVIYFFCICHSGSFPTILTFSGASLDIKHCPFRSHSKDRLPWHEHTERRGDFHLQDDVTICNVLHEHLAILSTGHNLHKNKMTLTLCRDTKYPKIGKVHRDKCFYFKSYGDVI